jgi:hypothetical protein
VQCRGDAGVASGRDRDVESLVACNVGLQWVGLDAAMTGLCDGLVLLGRDGMGWIGGGHRGGVWSGAVRVACSGDDDKVPGLEVVERGLGGFGGECSGCEAVVT